MGLAFEPEEAWPRAKSPDRPLALVMVGHERLQTVSCLPPLLAVAYDGHIINRAACKGSRRGGFLWAATSTFARTRLRALTNRLDGCREASSNGLSGTIPNEWTQLHEITQLSVPR